jgi:hypothetical protein
VQSGCIQYCFLLPEELLDHSPGTADAGNLMNNSGKARILFEVCSDCLYSVCKLFARLRLEECTVIGKRIGGSAPSGSNPATDSAEVGYLFTLPFHLITDDAGFGARLPLEEDIISLWYCANVAEELTPRGCYQSRKEEAGQPYCYLFNHNGHFSISSNSRQAGFNVMEFGYAMQGKGFSKLEL